MHINYKVLAALSLAVFVLPFVASAQVAPPVPATTTMAELQAEVQSLLAEIQTLEQQLTAARGTTPIPAPTTTWCYTFTTNLSIGMSGSAITALQTALQKDGESVTVTGTFDDQTASAVTTFQEKYAAQILTPYGLTNGTGYVGNATREVLNSLFRCTPETPVNPPIVVNPILSTTTPTPPIVACPTFIPNCPYGSHSVLGSNGCNETICNLTPTTTPIVACPLVIPYCPYGSYSVLGSNGCNETICNPAPTTTPIYGCPTFIPYCPYGSHSVLGSNGCNETICNPAPTSTPTSTTPGSIQITNPAANTQLEVGQTYQIAWTQPVPANPTQTLLFISLVPVNGIGENLTEPLPSYYFLKSQANGVGQYAYNWTVPNIVAQQYYIQIAENGFTTALVPVSVPGAQTPPSASSSPTMSVTTDPSQPSNGQIVMGSTGNTLAVYRFTNTSNAENVNMTALTVTDYTASSNKVAFSNVSLWRGSTLLGVAKAPVTTSNGYTYQFNFPTAVVIPQANSVSLTLKGDAALWGSGVNDNGVHQFEILSQSDVSAIGATTNLPATVTVSSASGYGIAVLRSTLAASATPLGSASNRIPSTVDTLGTITFSANTAGSIALNTVTVSFSGNAVSDNFLGSVQLMDQNNNPVTEDGAVASVNQLKDDASWTFSGSSFIISAGSSYSFTLRANTTQIQSQANVVPSLSAAIENPTDVLYADGADTGATQGLTLPPTVIPLVINSVTFPLGTGIQTSTIPQVQGLSAVASTSSVALTWSAVSVGSGQSPIAVYDIYKPAEVEPVTGIGGTFPTAPSNDVLVGQSKTNSYVVTNLSPGFYAYQVAAQNANGLIGPVSSIVSATIASPSSQTITVTMPTGSGTSVYQKTELPITWNGGTATVNINLWQNGTYLTALASGIANTGSYTWSVPTTYFGLGYQIQIGTVGISPGYTGSSGTFSIVVPAPPAPVITDVNSAGATPTPGSNEFLIGTNLPTQNATIVVDAGLASAVTITPTGYNVGGGGNMTFFLPSSVSVGSHTIEVQANGTTSNQFTFSVISGTPAPSLTLLSPQGNETFINNQTTTISWSSRNLSSTSTVTISLYHGTTGDQRNQFVNIPNSGSVAWTVNTPEAFDNTYKIIITAGCNSGGTACAATASGSVPFSISAVPTITIANDSATAASGNITAGTNDNVLAVFDLTAGSGSTATISNIGIEAFGSNANGLASNIPTDLKDISLWNSAGTLIQRVSPVAIGSNKFPVSISIPAGTTERFTIKGSVATTAVVGDLISGGILGTDIKSGGPLTVAGSAGGGNMKIVAPQSATPATISEPVSATLAPSYDQMANTLNVIQAFLQALLNQASSSSQ